MSSKDSLSKDWTLPGIISTINPVTLAVWADRAHGFMSHRAFTLTYCPQMPAGRCAGRKAKMNLYEQLFRLDGKVALVTGGYGGFGSAVCEGLAEMGASVAVAGHNADKVATFVADLTARGIKAYGVPFDACSATDTHRMTSWSILWAAIPTKNSRAM
jgi:short chain dehydrogenase